MKARLKKIENNVRDKNRIDMPIFLYKVNEFIFMETPLLVCLKVDYSKYSKYKTSGDGLNKPTEGYLIPKTAEFIHSVTSEKWAEDCYLTIKGYENTRTILLDSL
jgi:hypothetical protein